MKPPEPSYAAPRLTLAEQLAQVQADGHDQGKAAAQPIRKGKQRRARSRRR